MLCQQQIQLGGFSLQQLPQPVIDPQRHVETRKADLRCSLKVTTHLVQYVVLYHHVQGNVKQSRAYHIVVKLGHFDVPTTLLQELLVVFCECLQAPQRTLTPLREGLLEFSVGD